MFIEWHLEEHVILVTNPYCNRGSLAKAVFQTFVAHHTPLNVQAR